MALSYDDSLARLIQLESDFARVDQTAINEDTTRLRFIDALFLDCLDWDRRTQVSTEVRTEVGICDYVFSLDVPLLVVEAKRAGIYFELPREKEPPKRHVRSLDAVLSLDKDVAAAVTQAASYALEKGIPFAVVSNGWQCR